MGLAGPRKRAKISNDPNNTAWSRSTTGFGQTLLRSQGWNPGENLGARNAHHAHLYTAASSSHIKVLLREDNLGLGAKRGSGQEAGQCVGLDAFQGLLGRLNGKDEVLLQKEQDSRDAVKRVLYSDRRWGSMRFVSGGILVGNEIDGLINAPAVSVKEEAKTEHKIMAEQENPPRAVKSKIPVKRESSESESLEQRKTKRARKSPKKQKRDGRIPESNSQDEDPSTVDAIDQPAEVSTDGERRLRKEAKALRKAEKAKRKLERQHKKAMKLEKQASETSILSSDCRVPIDTIAKGNGISAGESTINSSTTDSVDEKVVPTNFGRHAVRSRFINQKRMAVRDPKALNEIFMIKAK